MPLQISKDADYLICTLYHEYRTRLKNGIAKSDAIYFGDAEMIQNTIAPELSTTDISEISRELCNNNYLAGLYADDELTESALTPSAIVYMENRFSNNVSSLLDTISKLRSSILG